MSFFENTRKPEGFGGKLMVAMMNLGHSFFLYHSTENDKIQVVYRRADGGYGVLIPEA